MDFFREALAIRVRELAEAERVERTPFLVGKPTRDSRQVAIASNPPFR